MHLYTHTHKNTHKCLKQLVYSKTRIYVYVYMYIKGNINLVNMCMRIRDKSYAILLGKCKWVVGSDYLLHVEMLK